MLQLKGSLQKKISKTIQKNTKRLQSLQVQAESAKNHEHTKLRADIIMANCHTIPDGIDTVELENWDTGKLETIPLDPKLDAIKNAEKYYKKARKERRGAEKIEPLIAESKESLECLMEAEIFVENIKDSDDDALEMLYQIESDLTSGGILPQTSVQKLQQKAVRKAKNRKKAKSTNEEYRKLKSPNGFEVLVGRSSQQNDNITMKIARTGDIWMHARGFPGAHVLLQVSSKTNLPEDQDIQFAADLAAFYSKGSNLNKVDVILADRKNISKPSTSCKAPFYLKMD